MRGVARVVAQAAAVGRRALRTKALLGVVGAVALVGAIPLLWLLYMRTLASIDFRVEPQDLIAPVGAKSFKRHFLSFENLEQNYGMQAADCKGYKVVYVVMTSPEDVEFRNIARLGWIRDLPANSTAKFFLGAVTDEELHERVEQEAKQYKDVIRNTLHDSLDKRVLKVYAALDWVKSHCGAVEYVVKVDANVIVLVDNLMRALPRLIDPKQPALLGDARKMVPVSRWPDNNYISPRDLSASQLPTHCLSATYVLNRAALDRMLKMDARQLRVFNREHVFLTGVLRQEAGVRVVHSKRFCGNQQAPITPMERSLTTCGTAVSAFRTVLNMAEILKNDLRKN